MSVFGPVDTAGLAAMFLGGFALVGCVQPDPAARENGTVLATAPADQPGENTGAGAVAGMVILGAAGGSVGEGAGKALAVAAGVLIGGAAGSAAEGYHQPHDGIAYTIRLTDGRVVTIVQHLNAGDPILRTGTAVTLQTSGRDQRILPQTS